MVQELLDENHLEIVHLYAVKEWLTIHYKRLTKRNIPITEILPAELERISTLITPNQVLVVVRIPAVQINNQLPEQHTCLFLDGIQDPGNMGTILRIADWFGIPAVYCAPDCADIYSSKVVQASMGAIFRVSCWKTTLDSLCKALPEVPVLGAVMDGASVFEQKIPNQGLLVIGNEGNGIKPENLPLLTHCISIPRHPNSRAESLNAAVATGILAALIPRS